MYFGIINKAKKQIDTKVGKFKILGGVTEEPIHFNDRKKLAYKEFKIGDSWGQLFACAWFNLKGKVDPKAKDTYFLKLDMNCEALLFDDEGTPLKGFTNGSSAFGFIGHLGSPAKRYFPLTDFIKEDGTVDLWLDAGMNDLFGNMKKKGRIDVVSIVHRNFKARELYYDIKTLVPMMIAAFKYDKEAHKIYRKGLNKISRLSLTDHSNWMSKSLEITKELYKTETKETHEVSSIGHSHLDLAWLWPIRETKRKGARTFANALRLMEEYPDFKFGASQPQLFLWVKEEHPKLYEQIKKRVAEGRWEIQGGMWVEADTNVSGEEALVRQMLYGTRFFKEEFGIRVKSLWLPDVFGYSGNMPQIIKKSGMDYFMTIKISWNDTNKFPHHTFTWEGIDGSDVFAHMPPEGEYNSPANTHFLLKSMHKYKEKHISKESLNLFGVGDGGGGVAPSHIERIRRLGGTAPMPKVKMETSWEFFEKLNKIKEKFPTYAGELYLEKHRGTYTSQSRVKYFNRRMEQKLKTIETLMVQTNSTKHYKSEIEEIWKEVLLYQFHDILPGSSIKRVYDECIERYEILDKRTDEITEEILGADLAGTEELNVTVIKGYNPLTVEATVDRITDNNFQEVSISAMSNQITNTRSWKKTEKLDFNNLENKYLKVVIARDGSIKSIFDKELNKEVLRNVGNSLKVYTDVANAWDIFRHYRKLPTYKMKLIKTEAFNYGPVDEVVQYYKYGKSTLIQKIRLKPGSRRLDFEIDAEWKSLKRMLRTSFPLNLKTDKAIYDIQFGHIERSSKNETKIEKAQYEASGHNWVDMNNGDWGASLITDSKYGFRTKDNTLDLHLIKSTNYPAKSGDIGSHHIKYGLYVHKGDHLEAKVDHEAMNFNSYIPLLKGGKEVKNALFKLSNENITYSTVKASEDGDDTIIRLYERSGQNQSCKLVMNDEVQEMFETNMVEENARTIGKNSLVELQFSPFEVKTIKVIN